MNFTAEELRRGAGDKDLRVVGIEKAPNERLPTRHDLYLIEVNRSSSLSSNSWHDTPVFVEQPPQVGCSHSHEPLVFQRHEEMRARLITRGKTPRHVVVQERRLAAAPNADDRKRLVGNFRKSNVTGGAHRNRRSE